MLIGHTTLRTHMFKLRPTQRQDCQLCIDKKKSRYTLYVIVWYGVQKIQNLGSYVLKSKGIEAMRVYGLISLVASTWLGEIP